MLLSEKEMHVPPASPFHEKTKCIYVSSILLDSQHFREQACIGSIMMVDQTNDS